MKTRAKVFIPYTHPTERQKFQRFLAVAAALTLLACIFLGWEGHVLIAAFTGYIIGCNATASNTKPRLLAASFLLIVGTLFTSVKAPGWEYPLVGSIVASTTCILFFLLGKRMIA